MFDPRGETALDAGDGRSRFIERQNCVVTITTARVVSQRIRSMLHPRTLVGFARSCCQGFGPAQNASDPREIEAERKGTITTRRVVFHPGLSPGEARIGSANSGGPNGGARTAENLLGFCCARIPDVNLLIIPASGGGEAPVGAERGGEDDVVALDVTLDGAVRGNLPNVLWASYAIAPAARRQQPLPVCAETEATHRRSPLIPKRAQQSSGSMIP